MNILVLTRHGRMGSASRLRFLQYLPGLEAAGLHGTLQSLIDDEMLLIKYRRGRYRLGELLRAYAARIRQLLQRQHFDLLWIEKEALPWVPASLERWLLRGVPYVLDYDDAIFHNYDLHRNRLVRVLWGRRVDRLMAGARLVIAGNDYLAQRARQAGAPWVEVLPTVIDLERYPARGRAVHADDVPRIVWIGSPGTVPFLARLAEPLAALARSRRYVLRVVGGKLALPGVEVECVDWTEDSEVASIADCDVGIMPLNDTPWERGKCGYKLIQYMACGLPVVASPVGVNQAIVRDGENGLLARDAQEWEDALARLLDSPALRAQMGRVGRKRAELEYSLQQVAPRLEALLRRAAGCQP
jgi:glycosyltransferase involved in cell wall biosynthesis